MSSFPAFVLMAMPCGRLLPRSRFLAADDDPGELEGGCG